MQNLERITECKREREIYFDLTEDRTLTTSVVIFLSDKIKHT